MKRILGRLFAQALLLALGLLYAAPPTQAQVIQYSIIDLLGTFEQGSRAIAVNSQGNVLVEHELESYFMTDQEIIALEPPQGASYFIAQGMNDQNEIVGTADGRPAKWSTGETSYLLGGQTQGTASAINNLGEIVGEFYPPGGGYHAYRLNSRGSFTDFGPGSLADINDDGASPALLKYAFTTSALHSLRAYANESFWPEH